MNRKNDFNIFNNDKKLFYYLFKYRAAMSAQIHRDIYKYSGTNITRNRLLKLKNAKYIHGTCYPKLNRMMAFGLSRKNMSEYINLGGGTMPGRRSYCPYHDLKLLEIWRYLSRANELKEYYTENEFQYLAGEKYEEIRRSVDGLNPDGVMTVNIKNNNFMTTLEFERSLKGKSRYFELFKNYYANEFIDAVFFICESDYLLRAINKIESDFLTKRISPKFFYCTSQDIFKGNKVRFKNINNKVITFNISNAPSDISSYDSLDISLQNMLQALNIVKFQDLKLRSKNSVSDRGT